MFELVHEEVTASKAMTGVVRNGQRYLPLLVVKRPSDQAEWIPDQSELTRRLMKCLTNRRDCLGVGCGAASQSCLDFALRRIPLRAAFLDREEGSFWCRN